MNPTNEPPTPKSILDAVAAMQKKVFEQTKRGPHNRIRVGLPTEPAEQRAALAQFEKAFGCPPTKIEGNVAEWSVVDEAYCCRAEGCEHEGPHDARCCADRGYPHGCGPTL